MLPFRSRLTLQQRRSEFVRVNTQRPDLIPAILERATRDDPFIDREKLLLPPNLSGSQLSYVVRRRLHMKPEEALFIMCNKTMIPSQMTMYSLYQKLKDPEDGFLYVTCSTENAFG